MPNDIADARAYIAECRETNFRDAVWVRTSAGRRIYLNAMSDADALLIARGFRRLLDEALKRMQDPPAG